MAQLKNTVVQGSLKATDTIYSSTGQFQIIKAPTTSGGSTYGPGTSGQVLKSNGSSVYWATDNNNTYYAPTTAGTAGQFLKAVGGTSMPTWNNIYYSDIKPAIKKTYASTSYYATAANDDTKSTFYFMSVRPDNWHQPWQVKFKVHTFCPTHLDYQSTTICTLSGRRDGIIYSNWNEQVNTAHYYISVLCLKEAGYNAGLGHAIGINIRNGVNYTNSSYYRTFEIEYYECDSCDVTLLDTPVLRADWANYNSTNYGIFTNTDASNRGLRESGDDNDVNRSMITCPRITTGSSIGIGRYTLFMEAADGTYQSITSTFNNVSTSHVKNSALFRPERIFFRNVGSDLAANNSADANNNWMDQQTSLIDLRYSTNCGKTLVGRKPVYLVGTIDANGFFTLRSENEDHTVSWWTQTEPTQEDGYVYIYLGMTYTGDESGNLNTQYRITFELDNPIYWYKNGQFVLYESPYLFSTSLTNTDLNTLNSANVHQRRFYSYFGAGSNGCTNLPMGDGQAFGLLSYPTASGLLTQELSSNAVTPGKWLRWYSATADAWTDWQKVITSSGGTISGNLTLTGALNLANNTWNTIGDDVYLGDINKSGHLGIQGKNGNTGLFFVTYNQTSKSVGGAITWDGTKFSITSTTPVAADISGTADKAIKDADGLNISTNYLKLSGGTMTGLLTLKTNLVFKCDDVTINTTTNNGNTGSSPIFRGINANDSTNTWYGQWHTAVNPDGTLNVYLNARNKKTDGTEVINSLIVGVKKDGTRYYQVSDAAAFRSALGLGSNATSSTAYLPLTGGTMTGQLKTSFNGAVAIGSRLSSQTTVDGLCEELRFSSGCMGSVNITTAYTLNGVTIPGGGAWYNYIWVPHRSGGNSGVASGDNCNYGTLYLYTMNSTTPHGFILTYSPTGSSGQTAIVKLVATAGFKNTPVDGQVLIGDGAYGFIQASGYTIAASVPQDAVFTDNKVQQSTTVSANWRKVILGKREMSSPNTALTEITDKVYGAQAIEAQPSTGTLRANIYRVANNVELQWNSTDSSLDFVFI